MRIYEKRGEDRREEENVECKGGDWREEKRREEKISANKKIDEQRR